MDFRIGDARVLIDQLPDRSVHLFACSPPFLNLRTYTDDDDDREVGREPDPAAFLTTLLHMVDQWAPKLADTGSLAIEVGDTLSGSAFRRTNFGKAEGDWPDAGSLCFIPELLGASLAYGRNLLTGEPLQSGPWKVRNKVTWFRTNPPTGSLGDRCRYASSLVTIATRSKDRWWDGTSLRDHNGSPALDGWPLDIDVPDDLPADTWMIPRQPSKLPHPAQWPPELAKRLVEAMCPAQVCPVCAEPRRRIEEVPEEVRLANRERSGWATVDGREEVGDWSSTAFIRAVPVTLGWTDCGCDAGFVPGVVVDPFAGSGTTLAVANILGRSAIGFDLDPKNADMLTARLAECRRVLLGAAPGRTFAARSSEQQPSLFGTDEELADAS